MIKFSDSPAHRRHREGWRELAYARTKLLYQSAQQLIIYMIPVPDILGRLPLVPYGEHGTIPYDWCDLACQYTPETLAERV